jgi:hypothetical protein
MNKIEIYERMYNSLINIACGLAKYHDACDVLQKVYIYLNNKDVNSFTDEKHIEHWLIWLTKSECMCLNRKNKKYVPIEDDEMNKKMCEKENPFEEASLSDLKNLILKKLPEVFKLLPPLQRNAARMYFLEGKDRHQICKVLKSTEGAVSSAISKSIKSISKYFQTANII